MNDQSAQSQIAMLNTSMAQLANQMSLLTQRMEALEKAEALRKQGEEKLVRGLRELSKPAFTIVCKNSDGSLSPVVSF
ncbi:hypothetical protein QR66_19565 [Chromobacterium piscinae]|nr:hypothetical protein QR66_19565 [Chromobacterium piscinae]